jgi:predicted RNA-binding Zn-ribbon protein involved in translation (DUF1610 family)
MIGLILLSMGITIGIALLASTGFYFIAPHLSFAVFFLTFAFEWIIMEPINRLIRNRSLRLEGETFDKMCKYEVAVGKQLVALECEYCGQSNAVKIDLSTLNTFTCSKCDNVNNVTIQFATTRVTNPLDEMPPISIGADENDNE